MRLSILIYDGLTTLDAIGGYEILARLPGMETEFVASRRGIIAADTRCLGLVAFREFSEVTATDILYVPGGPGGFALETDEIFLTSASHGIQIVTTFDFHRYTVTVGSVALRLHEAFRQLTIRRN